MCVCSGNHSDSKPRSSTSRAISWGGGVSSVGKIARPKSIRETYAELGAGEDVAGPVGALPVGDGWFFVGLRDVLRALDEGHAVDVAGAVGEDLVDLDS